MSQPVTLVTGASRGLGFATAKALGTRQHHIIALARTVGGLEELGDEVEASGGTTTLVPLDITDDPGLQRMALAIHERWGQLDILIHCAAYAAPLSPVGHIGDKDFEHSLATNTVATQRLITMCDPLLKAAPNGHAIFVEDTHMDGKFHAAYAASKSAALTITQSYAAESRQTGPKVSHFRPDPMPTALRARFYPGENREALASPQDEASRLIELL